MMIATIVTVANRDRGCFSRRPQNGISTWPPVSWWVTDGGISKPDNEPAAARSLSTTGMRRRSRPARTIALGRWRRRQIGYCAGQLKDEAFGRAEVKIFADGAGKAGYPSFIASPGPAASLPPSRP